MGWLGMLWRVFFAFLFIVLLVIVATATGMAPRP